MHWTVLAQQGGGNRPEEIAAMVAVLAAYLVIMVLVFALVGFMLYQYYTALSAIPPQFRTMEPGLVFLLLVPCFNIVWLFFVVQRIPESFRNYFNATEDYSRGDCGAGIGLWYAILSIGASVPYLGCLFSVPALVLMIMFIMKVVELKKAVLLGTAGAAIYGEQMGYYGGDPNNPYASPGKFPPPKY